MYNGFSHELREKTVVRSLSKNGKWGYVQHTDSDMSISDIVSFMEGEKVSFTEYYPEWNTSYTFFASADHSKVQTVSDYTTKSWQKSSRDAMIEMYEKIGLPKCCTEALRFDAQNGIKNSLERLIIQLIDISRQYGITSTDLDDLVYQKRKSEVKNLEKASVDELKISWQKAEMTPESDKEKEKKEDADLESKFMNHNNNLISQGILEGPMGIGMLNVRYSLDIPMCQPGCESVYANFTAPRISAALSLEIPLESVGHDAGYVLRNNFLSKYFKDHRASSSLAEPEKIIKVGLKADMFKKIHGVHDLEMSRLSSDVSKMKDMDEKTVDYLKMKLIERLESNKSSEDK